MSSATRLLPLRFARLPFGLLVLVVAALLLPGQASGQCSTSGTPPVTTCTSSSGITVSGTYGASEGSSTTVTGLSGSITNISLTLTNMDITNLNDVAMVLVPPSGSGLTPLDFLSGACGYGTDQAGNSTFTVADSAADGTGTYGPLNFHDMIPNGTCGTFSNTYLPADYFPGADVFNSPGPGTNYNSAGIGSTQCMNFGSYDCGNYDFSSFGSGSSAMNGSWSLYIANQNAPGSGYANPSGTLGSWTLSFTGSSLASTTTVLSTPSPNGSTSLVYTSSNVGGQSTAATSVTLTATVSPNPGGGTVTFYDSTGGSAGTGTVLASGVALNGSGVASTSVNFPGTSEGSRSISAVYSGDSSYLGSTSGTATVLTTNHPYNNPSGSTTFCNGPVKIPVDGASTPNPSLLVLGTGFSQLTGTIESVTVSLNNISLQNEANLDSLGFMLQAPGSNTTGLGSSGNAFQFLSWAGNPYTSGSLTIADDGTSQIPDDTAPPCTTCLPTDNWVDIGSDNSDTYPSPAPSPTATAAPTGSGTFSTEFGGLGANNTWSFYLDNRYIDPGPAGQVGSWCLNFTMQADAHPTATTASGSANPASITSGTTASVTLTANVSVSDSSGPVNAGTVSFVDGTTNLGSAPVSNGVATLSVNLGERTHQIVASYSGTNSGTEFGVSNGKFDERVDTATTQATGSGAGPYTYCNPGGVTVPGQNYDAGAASPYPSNIFVTNLPGTVNTATVTLDSASIRDENDLYSLLVGPGDTDLDFFSATGTVGAFAPSPVNLTFADSAGSLVSADPLPAGTYKPTSYNTSFMYPECPQNVTDCGTEDVGPPLLATNPANAHKAAPTGTGTFGLVYGGINGNGIWSLYLDDGGPNGGGEVSTLSKWCVNLTQNLPTVSATASHTGNFQQGEQNAQLAVNITNNGTGPTGDPTGGSNPLTVTGTLNPDFSYASSSGTGWVCLSNPPSLTCENDSAVAQGSSYPTLTIDVNVSPTANTGTPASNQVSVTGGGVTPTSSNIDSINIEPAPVLAVTKTHTGTFTQGLTAEWDITVRNTAASGSITMGMVTVSDTLPTGYTLFSYSGTGWTCSGGATANVSCTSSQGVSGGSSFTTLALTVSVPANSPVSVSNTASAFGGGDLSHTSLGSAVTGTDSNVPVVQVPATITIDLSQTQSAPIGTAFGTLAVTVKDGGGAVIPNYSSVTFTAGTAVSGATGTFSNSTGTVVVGTNSSGVADPGTFTANLNSGSYSVAVSTTTGSATATFSLTNTAVTPTINWTPATTIIFGSKGTNVLNASPSCGMSCGTITYTADASPTPITSTQSLTPGGHTITATFNPSSNGYNTNSATSPLTVSSESVWIVDGGGSTSELAGNGYGISSSAYASANLATAIDNAGNVWTVGGGSPLLEETNQLGALKQSVASGGGLDAPVGIAIDGSGQVWVADSGNDSVSLFTNGATAVSPSGGITDSTLATPAAIAVDLSGSVWVANKTGNSMTRFLGAAGPVAPLATAAAGGTTGARP